MTTPVNPGAHPVSSPSKAVDVLAVWDDLRGSYENAAEYTGEWCVGIDDDLIRKADEARAALVELIRVARIAEVYVDGEAPPEFAEEYRAALSTIGESQ